MPNCWVAMGYIKGVFGIKGWVKISADTEYIDSLLDYPEWRLSKGNEQRFVTVADSKIQGNELHVKLTGVDDRDAAFALRGYTIEVSREHFASTDEDEYYWVDLVGLTVINREGIELGAVRKLMQTGAHDILMVTGEYGEKLIPFVENYINEVNLSEKTISVDWGIDY